MIKPLGTATALASLLVALGSAAGAGPAPVQLAQMNAGPKIQPAPPPNLARPPVVTPKIDMSRLAGEKDEAEKETDANTEQVPQEAATGTGDSLKIVRRTPAAAGHVSGSPLPPARKDGWINGLSDEAGIRGMVERYFEENALLDDVLDSHGARSIEEFAKDFGVDPAAIKDLADTLRGQDIGIYRVELVPWLEVPMGGGDQGGGIPGMNPLDPTAGVDPWDPTGSGLGGGRPSGLGLVSTKHHRFNHAVRVDLPGGGFIVTERYEAKSIWVRTTIPAGENAFRTRDVVLDPGGQERVVLERTEHRDGRREVHETRNVRTGQNTEAVRAYNEQREREEAARQERQREATNQKPGGEKPDDDGQGGKVDKYQPADGTGAGSFCPLMLEFCRRALKEAEEKRSNLLLGAVLVNPGDPDVQPRGSRLVYDPEDLVINPASPQSRGRAPGRIQFRARIPVLINPPGPDEPQLQARQP